jgi:transcriptional regulator with XRE-family HTH domain
VAHYAYIERSLTPCRKSRKISPNVRQRQRRVTLEALRRARADAGLTISELAKRSGVSRDTVSNAERGLHSLQATTLYKVAHALGKAPSELLAEEERLTPKAQSSSPEPTFDDALGDEQRKDIFELALAAAKGQAEKDRKAANRALASESIPQPAYFKDHENAALQRLLEYPADELAGSVMELAGRVVQLEEERSERRLTEAPEYVDRLEELGFPSAQIAAWMAKEERDKEFIARELEKMGAKDFREALLASPGLRRIRDYYRETEAEAATPSRREPA